MIEYCLAFSVGTVFKSRFLASRKPLSFIYAGVIKVDIPTSPKNLKLLLERYERALRPFESGYVRTYVRTVCSQSKTNTYKRHDYDRRK